MSAMRPAEAAVARHEAGHFIVAMRLGHVLDFVNIIPEGDRNGVAVTSPGVAIPRFRETAEESAVVLLAG